MNISYQKILGGLVLGAAVILAAVRTFPPPALSASAPVNEFSAQRAIRTIKAITGSPRLVGSPAYEAAREYLLAQLAALGLETDVQATTLDGVRVENILGRLKGSESTDAILLSAHLDSVSNSPGATDDGSGIAVIMETLHALQAVPPLRDSIIVLFTGPEENCCFGGRAFVTRHAWAKDVRLVVNVDAGGLDGPSILAATGPDAGWLIEQAAHALPDPVGSSAIEALGSPATDYTLMFRKAGWLGFDFNLSWSKRIHSPLDNVENLNPASLQHQGEHMLAVVRHFAGLSLEFPKIPRPVYFDILSLTMVYYPTSWAIFILLAVTLLFGGAIFLGFRRKCLTLRGIGFGAFAFVLSLLTVPLLLGVIQLAIYHPSPVVNTLVQATPAAGKEVVMETRSASQLESALIGDSLLSNGIRWGSAILSLATTLLWYVLLRNTKKVEWFDLAVGTYLLLYLGACGTSLAFPALSYLFVWPLLVGSIGMLFWFSPRKGTTDRPGWFPFLWSLAAGVVAIVMFVPGILIALLSIDIRMIYLVPVFVVALLSFLVPTLEVFFGRK